MCRRKLQWRNWHNFVHIIGRCPVHLARWCISMCLSGRLRLAYHWSLYARYVNVMSKWIDVLPFSIPVYSGGFLATQHGKRWHIQCLSSMKFHYPSKWISWHKRRNHPFCYLLILIYHLHSGQKGVNRGTFVYRCKHECDHMTGTWMTGCSAGPATDRALALILAHGLRVVN